MGMVMAAPAIGSVATALGVGAMVGGTVLQYKAQRDAAKAAEQEAAMKREAAYKEAAYMEQQATQAVAASQRDMLAERKQAELLQSRALAVAAASGAGASDTTVENIIANISGEGAYREKLALYSGKQKSLELRTGAEIRRAGGDLQAQYGRNEAAAHRIGSVATLFSGAGTLANRYG